MFKKNFNIGKKKNVAARILIAPLDWGLGHSTRCIPIIKELLEQGCEVLIAAEGAPKSVLQNEFPQLIFLSIKNYNIQYSHKTKLFSVALLLQTPQILFAIYKEHQWLKKIVKEQNIDALISDNRFGLYHSIVPSVYITHQLLIKTNNCFTEKIAQRIHYWFIKKHTQCWVPDFEKEPAIAGELSHPKKLPASVNYIGCLSRFEKKPGIEKKYDLLIILSGPEPQRTIFENILLQQLKEYNGIVLLVRGLPTNSLNNINSGNIKIVNHLKSSELNIAIQQSEIVISRSGYTTIMDLIKLQKKAVLVPTPGQTEQEYLGKYLVNKKIFYSVKQDAFSLKGSIKKAEKFSTVIPEINMNLYKDVIRRFIESLK